MLNLPCERVNVGRSAQNNNKYILLVSFRPPSVQLLRPVTRKTVKQQVVAYSDTDKLVSK